MINPNNSTKTESEIIYESITKYVNPAVMFDDTKISNEEIVRNAKFKNILPYTKKEIMINFAFAAAAAFGIVASPGIGLIIMRSIEIGLSKPAKILGVIGVISVFSGLIIGMIPAAVMKAGNPKNHTPQDKVIKDFREYVVARETQKQQQAREMEEIRLKPIVDKLVTERLEEECLERNVPTGNLIDLSDF